MHDCDDSEPRVLTPAEENDRDEEGILAHVLAEHPDQLTITELAREMKRPGEAEAPPPDWLERGVRDLVALGLLHRSGDTIRPTRAALRFNHLFFDRD